MGVFLFCFCFVFCLFLFLFCFFLGGGLFFVFCLTSQQHASVSQGRICSDNFTCCHTETEVAGQTFHLTVPSHSMLTPG